MMSAPGQQNGDFDPDTIEGFRSVALFARRELVAIHHRLEVFKLIWGSDERRVQVLNQYSPRIGGLFQEVLLDAIVMGLCQLLDRDRISGSPNLSLGWLARNAERHCPGSEVTLIGKWNAAKETASSLLERRNKAVSHNDHGILFSKDGLGGIVFPEIQKTISACHAVVGALPEELRPAFFPEDFSSPDAAEGDVLAFLRVMHLGNQAYSAHLAQAQYRYDLGDDAGDPETLSQVEPWLRHRRFGG